MSGIIVFVSSIYISGSAFLERGKLVSKHSITIFYIVFFIRSILLLVNYLHKFFLFSKYLSIDFCTNDFIIISLIFLYLHFQFYLNYYKIFHLNILLAYRLLEYHYCCDAPKSRCSLTTRQPAENS